MNRLHRLLGLSPAAVFGLALLAAPRAVAHDLQLVGPVVNALLVFVPLAVWAGAVLWWRVPNPFRPLSAVGFVYGILLAIVHQVLWTAGFAGGAPRLGGNLTGVLSPAAEQGVLRLFSVLSSVTTGILVGAAVGAVCWALTRLVPGLGFRRPGGEISHRGIE